MPSELVLPARGEREEAYFVCERCGGWWNRAYLGIINQDVLDDWLSCGLPINHPDIVHLVPSDLTVLLEISLVYAPTPCLLRAARRKVYVVKGFKSFSRYVVVGSKLIRFCGERFTCELSKNGK
ncbi:hypothetical protein EYF80_011565 [Liparis tanakae]|uniref:Uncharacterized protein n=1 Tax=Liparis tanakae TaxID=230148 RepID=A0A4Z2IKJ3_9TELE|nr:hypothetical protein EYF80_011565 [Liparis tanakae]